MQDIDQAQAAALVTALKEVVDISTTAVKKIVDVFTGICNEICDAFLYAAADNPKDWHYYKHAKKLRTRKKYRNKLWKKGLSRLKKGALI